MFVNLKQISGFYQCVDPSIMYNGVVHQLCSNEVKGYITTRHVNMTILRAMWSEIKMI